MALMSMDELGKFAWANACTELQYAPLDFHPGPEYFNRSTFDHDTGGCNNDQVWLVCKGANTSESCYNILDIVQFEQIIPPKYAYAIYGIVFPCLVSLAVMANLFVLMVLSQRHMHSPTNTVLMYMAIADLCVGIVPLPFTVFWFTLRTYVTPKLLSPFWCYVYHYTMDTIPPICHNVAIWLTVLLAVQRYIYIEHPLKAHYYCKTKDVKRASLIILIVSTISGSMKFGDSVYDTYSGYTSMGSDMGVSMVSFVQGACISNWSPIVRWVGSHKYLTIHFWIRATLFVWLPCALLICLNIMLIRALHETQRRRQRLFTDNGIRQRERQKESYATSTMLVVIVSVFLLVNLPQGLFVALITCDQAFNLQMGFLAPDGIAPLILMIDNMLIIATYPLNFAIYCYMSTLFRETFKRIFCKRLPPLAASRRASSFGYCSYSAVGTVVPVVQDATAAATLIFNTHQPKMETLIQESNGKTTFVLKDDPDADTKV